MDFDKLWKLLNWPPRSASWSWPDLQIFWGGTISAVQFSQGSTRNKQKVALYFKVWAKKKTRNIWRGSHLWMKFYLLSYLKSKYNKPHHLVGSVVSQQLANLWARAIARWKGLVMQISKILVFNGVISSELNNPLDTRVTCFWQKLSVFCMLIFE